jgi:hypothetical protein
MTLAERLEQAAEAATTGGPPPWSVRVAEGGVEVTLELTAIESLACAFERLDVRNVAWAGKPIAEVKRVAEDLAKRLTYLLETIRPIETDPEHCVVQMRSSPPRREEDKSSYYELIVERSGALSLRRYEKQPGDVRRQVPILLTREVFRRLLTDFAAVK